MSYDNPWVDSKETILSGSKAALQIDKLKAENAKLRAELDALKPKPVVEISYYEKNIYGNFIRVPEQDSPLVPLRLEFHDGKLFSAMVKNEKGEWICP